LEGRFLRDGQSGGLPGIEPPLSMVNVIVSENSRNQKAVPTHAGNIVIDNHGAVCGCLWLEIPSVRSSRGTHWSGAGPRTMRLMPKMSKLWLRECGRVA